MSPFVIAGDGRAPTHRWEIMTAAWATRPHPATAMAIDAMRGLAALGVIVGHSLPWALNGAYWVWMFLVISGYLVGVSFARYGLTFNGYRRFLWNRGLRILPLGWTGLALGWLMAAVVGTVPSDLWREFLFLPATDTRPLVGPLWTIAVEWQFYLLAPIFVFLTGRARSNWHRAALLLAGVGSALIAIRFFGDSRAQPRSLLGNLPCFLIGLLLAQGVRAHRRILSHRAVAWTVAGLALAAWALQWLVPGLFWRGVGAAMALVSATLVLIVTFSDADQTPARLWRVLAWCGVYTYGIYVWQAVLGVVLETGLLPWTSTLAHLGWLSLAVAIAPVSHRFLEAPFLRYKARGGWQASNTL